MTVAPAGYAFGTVRLSKALIRRDIDDVAQRLPVRAAGGEVALKQVRRRLWPWPPCAAVCRLLADVAWILSPCVIRDTV
jgi:hypothetical protein